MLKLCMHSLSFLNYHLILIIIDLFLAQKPHFLKYPDYLHKSAFVEASLIGKALNFGFNDYGFESHASKINYNRWLNYVANHINLNIAKKNLRFTIVCNKTTLSILNLFKVSGFILAYHLITKNGQTSVVVYIYFYKKTLLFRNLKIISTASRSFFITRKALFLIEKRTLNSILMLSTSHGIISHTKALQKGIGGKLLFLVF